MKKTYTLLISLLIAQLLLAIYCGPHSCEWGNTVYVYAGIIIALLSFSVALARSDWSLAKRGGMGLLFLVVSVVCWVIGFSIGGFSILCRLF